MAHSIWPGLSSGPDARPATPLHEDVSGPQTSASGPDRLGFGLNDPPWPGDRGVTPATIFYGVLVGAIILTVAALIAGGAGLPAFSFGLAIGVGVGAVPYVLFCAVHARASSALGGPSQRRRKLTEEEWQHIFGPRMATGATNDGAFSGAASPADDPGASHAAAGHAATEEELSAYKLLGLSADASMKQVTAAYHQLAHRYHPDKVAGQDDKARMRAEKRMKELNAAYDLLRRQRHHR